MISFGTNSKATIKIGGRCSKYLIEDIGLEHY